MANTSEKYGEYYGELVKITRETDITFDEDEDFAQELLDCNVVEAFFDVEDVGDWSSTVFFEVGPKTNMQSLLLLIGQLRCHEFHLVSPNCYRAWFD